jgi:hypothetical protein
MPMMMMRKRKAAAAGGGSTAAVCTCVGGGGLIGETLSGCVRWFCSLIDAGASPSKKALLLVVVVAEALRRKSSLPQTHTEQQQAARSHAASQHTQTHMAGLCVLFHHAHKSTARDRTHTHMRSLSKPTHTQTRTAGSDAAALEKNLQSGKSAIFLGEGGGAGAHACC